MKNKYWEEIFVSLSCSNLLFLVSWRRLIYPSNFVYLVKLEPHPLDYLAAILGVVIVTLIFFGVIRFSRSIFKGQVHFIFKFIFLGIFVVIVNCIFFQFSGSAFSIFAKTCLFFVFAASAILLLLIFKNKIFEYLRLLMLILLPFAFVTFSQAVIGMINFHPSEITSLSTQLSAMENDPRKTTKARIVWIIFDELDYFASFESKSVALPEFEKLKSESLFATKAAAPAYDTIVAIPSLLTGQKAVGNKPVGKDELFINFEGAGDWVKFSETPNIFTKVREMKGNTAVVGWFHPYCRVIGKDLSACQWESFETVGDFENQSLLKKITKDLIDCFTTLPYVFQGFSALEYRFEDRSGYVTRHYEILEGAKSIASNSSIDLAFIHLPLPHNPNFFDRRSSSFKDPGEISSYVDNLALSDQVLGEIRQTMINANLWNESTVIVSSDHQWRINRWKNSLSFSDEDFWSSQGIEHPNIPFFLKLKNQKESLAYEKPFNTVITSDLILAIMKGEISKPEEVQKWLDKNSEN